MLLNLIKHQRAGIDKIYLYVKDPFESKYQLLINGRERVGTENLKNPKAFIGDSQTIDDVYENLELNPFVTELFLRGRKLNISLNFISQSYFKVPKTITLNATHYLSSPLSPGNVSKYEFLTSKDVLPEKDLLEKAAIINKKLNIQL